MAKKGKKKGWTIDTGEARKQALFWYLDENITVSNNEIRKYGLINFKPNGHFNQANICELEFYSLLFLKCWSLIRLILLQKKVTSKLAKTNCDFSAEDKYNSGLCFMIYIVDFL